MNDERGIEPTNSDQSINERLFIAPIGRTVANAIENKTTHEHNSERCGATIISRK